MERETPPEIRVFEDLGFDYSHHRISGMNAWGNCVFCGGNKFYVNIENGLWSCKTGRCMKEGNKYTFIQEYYAMILSEQNLVGGEKYLELAQDRLLPPDLFREAGVAWNGECWLVPLRNISGTLTNLRRYWYGQNCKGLSGIEVNPYGMEQFREDKADVGKKIVYICEGEWDALAMRDLLTRSGQEGVVIGVPGAGIWKDTWVEAMTEYDIVLCYDNDTAGAKGSKRVYSRIRRHVKSVSYICWPPQLPEGFDLRDFVSRDGTWEELSELIQPYVTDEDYDSIKNSVGTGPGGSVPTLKSSERPSFEQVIDVFKKHIHMTDDMILGYRIACAVTLTTQIEGDPLWMHIVGPPGSGKTVVVMSLQACRSVYAASTITPNALVSGFSGPGGSDISLIPKLNRKTFALKDFTEILKMSRQDKDEVYSILRGAYDGEVIKHYGNGIMRKYNVHFNMISGVTHAVFMERSTSLGERFLIFHMIKGLDFDAEDPIRKAVSNVGKELEVSYELSEITKRFLEVTIEPDDMPQIPSWFVDRMIAMAQIVAVLRASVERDTYTRDKLLVRPQQEMGTRLAKQLTKLAMGLSLTKREKEITEEIYGWVLRVALDTCVGFNLEVITHLMMAPGLGPRELAQKCNLPLTTIRDHIDDLEQLGVVRRTKLPNASGIGAPVHIYFVSDVMMKLWTEARVLEFTTPRYRQSAVRKTKSIRRVLHASPGEEREREIREMSHRNVF